MKTRLMLAALACVALTVPARAQNFAATFDGLLRSGRIADAQQAATERLAEAPDDPQAKFALGAAQFLGAVEAFGHGLYSYGLISGPQEDSAMAEMPFLRLPIPHNPHPQPMTYDGLRRLIQQFGSDLALSEETLASVPDGPVALPLDAGEIRFDFAGSGSESDRPTLAIALSAITGVPPEKLGVIEFDEGDVPWLEGYAHLLQGLTDFLLAHDFSRSVDLTFHDLFPYSELTSAPLRAAAQEQRLIVAAIGDEACTMPDWYWERAYGEGDPGFTSEEKARIETAQACGRAQSALWASSIGDLVAFVHLFDWPVVEPERMKSSRLHLLDMIALSRESWRLIVAETDDNHEWLPSPPQTSPFKNMQVTEQRLEAWSGFLDEAEGVLQGNLLIPHWRFPNDRGLNIRRIFDEPRRFDLVLLVTGVGAIPYVEEGPLAPDSTMEGLDRVIGSGPLAYFLWFN